MITVVVIGSIAALLIAATLVGGGFMVGLYLEARNNNNHEYRMARMRYRYRWEALYDLLEMNGAIPDGGASFDDIVEQLERIETEMITE